MANMEEIRLSRRMQADLTPCIASIDRLLSLYDMQESEPPIEAARRELSAVLSAEQDWYVKHKNDDLL